MKPKCWDCKQEVFTDLDFTKAWRPGHIYSQAGIAEFRISGTCEYCFDKMCDELEED